MPEVQTLAFPSKKIPLLYPEAPRGTPRSQAHPQISEWSERGGAKPKKTSSLGDQTSVCFLVGGVFNLKEFAVQRAYLEGWTPSSGDGVLDQQHTGKYSQTVFPF